MALPLPFVSVEMSFVQAQALGRSMGRWGVRGVEAVSDLSPCLSHSPSICRVSAVCQALHWEYDGKKYAAVSRRLTTECLHVTPALSLSASGCCGGLCTSLSFRFVI